MSLWCPWDPRAEGAAESETRTGERGGGGPPSIPGALRPGLPKEAPPLGFQSLGALSGFSPLELGLCPWPTQRSQCLVLLFLWCKQCFFGKANVITSCIFCDARTGMLLFPGDHDFRSRKDLPDHVVQSLHLPLGGHGEEPRVVANSTADWGPQLWSPKNLIGRKLDFKTWTLPCQHIWLRGLHSCKITPDSSAL